MKIKTKTKFNDRDATQYIYDEKGRIILKRYLRDINKPSEELKTYYEYNEELNIVHKKRSDNSEEWIKRNDQGDIVLETILYVDGSTTETKYQYEYDEYGNITHLINSEGEESYYHYKYDDNGNIIKELNTHGKTHNKKYDEKGRLIYHTYDGYNSAWEPTELYEEYKYDDNGNCISIEEGEAWKGKKCLKDWIRLYEYDEHGNCIIEKTESESFGGKTTNITHYEYEYYED